MSEREVTEAAHKPLRGWACSAARWRLRRPRPLRRTPIVCHQTWRTGSTPSATADTTVSGASYTAIEIYFKRKSLAFAFAQQGLFCFRSRQGSSDNRCVVGLGKLVQCGHACPQAHTVLVQGKAYRTVTDVPAHGDPLPPHGGFTLECAHPLRQPSVGSCEVGDPV